MRREKFKSWRKKTPNIHRSYGEKRLRNKKSWIEDIKVNNDII